MEDLTKKIFLSIMALAVGGCGVKGRPVAPKTIPPIGRGEPTYKETQKKKSIPHSTSEESSGR